MVSNFIRLAEGVNTDQTSEENAGTGCRSPVSCEDCVIKIPYVPVALSQNSSTGACRSTAQEHDDDLTDEDTSRLRPRCLRWTGCISGDIWLVDENGAKCRHDGVDGLYHRPYKSSSLQCRTAKIEVTNSAAICMDSPSHYTKESSGGRDRLDDEQMPDYGRVDKHDGELNDPENKKGKQILGRNSRALGKSVGDLLPAMAKNGAQGNRGNAAAIV